MRRSVIHVLPETEPFSEFDGGAISRWVANILRGDDLGVVICPESDHSWNEISAVKTVRDLVRYRSIRPLAYKAGWRIRTAMLRHALEPALRDLHSGDVVWVHNRPDTTAAIQSVVHKAGARLVLHMHNSHLLNVTSHQFSEMSADYLVFVSNYLQSESAQAHAGMPNCTVLYNGADDRIFHPGSKSRSNRTEPVVLFASRLVPEKGAHIFTDAMRELQRRSVGVRGIVVGASKFGGSKETEFVRNLQRQAPDNVVFRPYCVGGALGEMFREADIFCLPSVWQDPFPLAPLEAMASGLPVVATRSGGIPEALRDGGGILVGPGSVIELADALERLVRDPLQRARLAGDGERSYKRNFTWKTVRAKYEALTAAV